ncbi:hypothetical protein HID58_019062 [Brassica napus]|uniref:Uncharacterized protein n=1 Tax=Brassica napus TaxID=3708 RepID=A0ABQ8DBQ9_BRANA|nr:hypothetical protein HID58_019062 [Brassica napus]
MMTRVNLLHLHLLLKPFRPSEMESFQNPDWETEFNRFERAISSSPAPIRVRSVIKLSALANQSPESILTRAIPILAGLLRVSDDPNRSVQAAAAHCLKRIACLGGEFAATMGRCGVIASLLGLLLEQANDNGIALRRIWVKCLWSLVTFGSSIRVGLARHSVSVIRDSGAIPLLVGLVRDGSLEFRERISGAISQLCYNENDREVFSESGMIPILIEWLGDESEELRDNAAEALINFSEDREHYGRVREALNHPVIQSMQSRLARIRASHEHLVRSMRRVTIEHLARDPYLP